MRPTDCATMFALKNTPAPITAPTTTAVAPTGPSTRCSEWELFMLVVVPEEFGTRIRSCEWKAAIRQSAIDLGQNVNYISRRRWQLSTSRL